VQPAQAGRATQLRAEQVDTLGGIVVFFAWFVGVVSAGGGLLYALASMNKPVQLISALTFALIGLVQAVFLALIGRYAQLRAAQATNR
jgi:hypothetical protein